MLAQAILVFLIFVLISSFSSPCLYKVLSKKLGSPASEVASSPSESQVPCGRIWTVVFLCSARVSLCSGKMWEPNLALAQWGRGADQGEELPTQLWLEYLQGAGGLRIKGDTDEGAVHSLPPSRSPRWSRCPSVGKPSHASCSSGENYFSSWLTGLVVSCI